MHELGDVADGSVDVTYQCIDPLHAALDGFSRLAHTEALEEEKANTTIEFFCRAGASG